MIKLNHFIFIIKLFLVILKKEYNYSRNKERKRIIYLSKKMKKYHYLYHKNYIMRLFFLVRYKMRLKYKNKFI